MLSLVTAPTVEPVSAEEARAQCKAILGVEDSLISGYQLAARHLVEAETGRALLSQEWELALDAWPSCIVLPKPPSISVTWIKYTDSAGTEQTLASDQYRALRSSTGEFEIVPAYGVTWPAVRAESAAIRVRFLAGYGAAATTVPAPLKQAIQLLVGHWYANREAVSAKGVEKELPLGVGSLIFPYRVFY